MQSLITLFRGAAAAAAAIAFASSAHAFSLTGTNWPNRCIAMQLQLGAGAAHLTDGATAWGDVAESALNEWNAQLVRSKFSVVHDSTAAKAQGNRINNVYFSA